MRIGIFTFRQFPFVSANTSIGYTIGREIGKTHQVVFIGYKQDASQNDVREYSGMPVRFLNNDIVNKNTRFHYLMRKIIGDRLYLHRLSKGLRKIAKDEQLDALLCVTAPSDDAMIAAYAGLDIPLIWLQLDPFYNGNDIVNPKLKRKFLALLPEFKHLFTTDLLYGEYVRDSDVAVCLNEISVAQFPKLLTKDAIFESREKNKKPRLLFAGSLYRNIRNPRILAGLKQCLGDACEVVFCGGCDCPEDMKCLETSGVLNMGFLQENELLEQMIAADVYVNIGNKVRNQLGSKLIDYISTGKPILNITQFNDCPTIKVLEKYDLKLNVSTAGLEDKDSTIMKFIFDCVGCQMKRQTLIQRYCSYTPEYVARQIVDKIVE